MYRHSATTNPVTTKSSLLSPVAQTNIYVYPWLTDHVRDGSTWGGYPIRIRFKVATDMGSSDPIVITLPDGMFTFTSGSNNVRCYLKWFEANGKQNLEAAQPSACTYSTSPDTVTFYPRSSVKAANLYEMVIENYDST